MIDELALLVNNNFKKPLNEQIMDYSLIPARLFTTTGTFTPSVTGLYRIICIGAGGNGGNAITGGSGNKKGGGAGGVVIGIKRLTQNTVYNVTIGNNASFGNLMTATAGGDASIVNSAAVPGTGGSGSGDDCQIYDGNDGTNDGGDVGVFSLGMIGIGGAGFASTGQGGGGGGFGGGGGGRYFYTGSGTTPKGGNGGIGFGGGRGADLETANTLGGGGIDTTYNYGYGGSAAVFVEFISEVL